MVHHQSLEAVSTCFGSHALQWWEGAKGGSHYGHGIVVEDCGDIFRGKFVGGIADEETCLADRTVADDDTPIEKMGLV